MGWAPPAAEIGDDVVVFPGCHIPVVVRRVALEKFIDANLVFTHDAKDCTHSACEAKEIPFY